MSKSTLISRRHLLIRAAALGTAATLPWSLRAAGYPEKDLEIVVPTQAGGGADRTLAAIIAIWEKYLGVKVEMGFFPGASGQVGYAVYTGKREPDAYSLIYGNMGPELIGWVLQKPEYKFREDWTYFFRTDEEPCVIFVRAESPFKTIEDVVAEGKKRTLTVGTSRLPHPASIGTLALGEATGAKFNLIPLSGGNKTIAGVMTGEVDIGALPAGVKPRTGDTSRILCVFDDKNPLKASLDNAPTANEVFGSKIPPLPSSRAFGIHTRALTEHSDRVQVLLDTLAQTFADPGLKEEVEKNKVAWETISPGSQAECDAYADGIIELAHRYEPLLTGKDDG
jgi:tripartite-type tricarboxylate transporter receptor subunit TctC